MSVIYFLIIYFTNICIYSVLTVLYANLDVHVTMQFYVLLMKKNCLNYRSDISVSQAAEEGAREDVGASAPGNAIIAGLCHTAQLTSLLAHILSVSLPHRQCYR